MILRQIEEEGLFFICFIFSCFLLTSLVEDIDSDKHDEEEEEEEEAA